VPPAAGLFSALGLIFADVEHQCIRAYYQPLDALDLEDLNGTFAALRDEATELLAADGYDAARQELIVSAEVKYIGQNTALVVPIKALPVSRDDLAEISESFAVAHETTFGYRSDEERLQFVSLKVVGRGIPDAPRLPDKVQIGDGFTAAEGTRQAYFGPEHGWLETPVTGRAALAGTTHAGPLIVEEYDTTTVVRPGWRASLDEWNNIVLTKGKTEPSPPT
jgi:N-methylhydantoinase A